MWSEFQDFLKKYGIIGLTIAVIIGGKVNAFVNSLVHDLITPLVFQPILSKAHIENINDLNFNGILYGKVFASFLEFLIIAFILFIFTRKFHKAQ